MNRPERQPAFARLVDVPCCVVSRSATALTIAAAGGRRAVVPLSHVQWESADTITIPEWLANQEGLLTAGGCLVVADLASLFRHSIDWVYRNLPKLYDEGFPRPVSQVGQSRWDPSSVEAWLQRHGPDRPAPARTVAPPPAADVEADHARQRAQLAEVYGHG